MKLNINWRKIEADDDIFEKLERAKQVRENMFKIPDEPTITF